MSALDGQVLLSAGSRERQVREHYERWRAWRWPLLAVLVAVELAAVLSSPVRADAEDFYGDLAAGRVQAIQPGSFVQDPSASYPFEVWRNDDPERMSAAGVRWVGRFGAVYQADLANGPVGTYQREISPDQVDVAATAAANATRARKHPPAPSGRLDPPGGPLLPLAVAAMLILVVGLLVAGPQPRRFTKWGWFWLIAVLPAGLGAVWYLVREAPWSERTSTISPLPPRHTRARYDPVGPPRRGGVRALIFGLFFSQLLAVLLAGGLATLTDHHAPMPRTWITVDRQGQSVVGRAPGG